ncbi:MAG: DUF599 domain-containing protein [Hyphomicrobiaceae bacterium]
MTNLDIAAFAWFCVTLGLFELSMRSKRFSADSLTAAVQAQRRRWVEAMLTRDQRQFDALLMSNLTQSHAFFASTSVLGIGGLAAIMGAGDAGREIIQKLPYVAPSTAMAWELKLIFMMSILVYAFFKFAWAFRLSHYTVMVFGALPAADAPDNEKRQLYADTLSRLLGLVGEHANAGLRSFYLALAAIAWFFHPVLFMAASAGVILVLLRREHFSRAAQLMRSIRT